MGINVVVVSGTDYRCPWCGCGIEDSDWRDGWRGEDDYDYHPGVRGSCSVPDCPLGHPMAGGRAAR